MKTTHLIDKYNAMLDLTPEIHNLNAKIRRRLYTLVKTLNSWIWRAIFRTNAAKLILRDQCHAMDMALVYASLDYDRRHPVQEIKMTEHKVMLLRSGGGL